MLFNEMQVGRFASAMSALTGITGPSPAPTLGPELVPVIIAQDDALDMQLLKSVRLYAATMEILGVAAKQALMQMLNPLGSNQLVTVTGLSLWSDIATATFDILVAVYNAAIPVSTPLGGGSPRDTRLGSFAFSTSQFSAKADGVAARSGNLIDQFIAVTALQAYDRDTGFVFAPGGGMQIFQNTLAARIEAHVTWSERTMAPGEQVQVR